MTFDINNLTIHNDSVRSYIKTYMNRISSYPNFDSDMLLRVFVDDSGDFCAFESVDYNINFVSQKHKIGEMLHSRFAPCIVKYSTFSNLVSVL